MRYMIHSAPPRQWYVDEFLIPSMLKQGIPEKDIVVKCDTEGKGNLFSCMDSFIWCGENTADGTWHMQDDAIISSDFAEVTRKYDSGVVCGAVIKDWGPDWTKTGVVPMYDLWYSFLCIRIPDKLAHECGVWFYTEAMKRNNSEFQKRIKRKKHDDDFFRFFLYERHQDMQIRNLSPNIVDHVDYLIGGSLVNRERKREVNRVAYWKDESLVQELEDKLYARAKARGEA